MIEIKRIGNALVYQTGVKRLMNYSKCSSLTFQEIDYNLLEGFKNQLVREGIKKNSVGNYFRWIIALFNKAIKAKIADRVCYPFDAITIKTEKTEKRAISINEVKDIYNYKKKPNTQICHASNYFFLSLALPGISFTGMAYLKKENIYKGYLTYRRRKTKKLYTIKLLVSAIQILDYYKDNPTDYLLPVFPKGTIEDGEDSKKITRQWIKVTNRYLNRIAKYYYSSWFFSKQICLKHSKRPPMGSFHLDLHSVPRNDSWDAYLYLS